MLRVRVGDTDVTPYLFHEGGIGRVHEAPEVEAFRRAVGDVHLELSNVDDTFFSMFASIYAATEIEVVIAWSGEVIFGGFLDNPTIRLDYENQRISLDAFSYTKRFWEWAGEQKVQKPRWPKYTYATNTFITVNQLVGLQLSGLVRLPWLAGHTVDISYYKLPIRCAADSTTYGNQGRLIDLSPEHTIQDLFVAMSKWYNAEFLVDHATKVLHMVPRVRATESTVLNVDDHLKRDPAPITRFVDEEKYDYVRTYGVASMAAPSVDTAYGAVYSNSLIQGLLPGSYTWLYCGVIDGVPRLQSGTVTAKLEANVLPSNQRWAVRMRMRGLDSVFSELWLYRQGHTTGRFYRIGGVVNPGLGAEATLDDFYNNDGMQRFASPLPYVSNEFFSYRRYNEETGAWANDVLDYGSGTEVRGKVLDVYPELRFQVAGVDIPNDPYWVYSFFGREEGSKRDEWRTRWVDFMRTRRAAEMHLDGVAYRIGQPIQSKQGLLPNDFTPATEYVIRSREIDLIGETTQIVGVSV